MLLVVLKTVEVAFKSNEYVPILGIPSQVIFLLSEILTTLLGVWSFSIDHLTPWLAANG